MRTLKPLRFDDTDLKERELSYGKAGFALQFQLNPNLSDAERYPLRLRDFIVADTGADNAPLTYQWLPNPTNLTQNVPVVGLKGDVFHGFHSADNRVSTFTAKIMAIDPSGRGKDETGYAVLYFLNGYIYLMETGGFRGGYEDATLELLAKKAKQWKVNEVLVEGNFGDGMFLKIFSPILTKHHYCTLTETKSKGQKEVRIADTLEPVLGAHRLVVTPNAIVKDYQTARNTDGQLDVKYSLFYQLSRLTRDRGALAHDDRLDAFAIGVAYFVESLEKDSERGAQELTEDWLMEQLDEDRIHHQMRDVIVNNGSMEINLGYDDWSAFEGVSLCSWD